MALPLQKIAEFFQVLLYIFRQAVEFRIPDCALQGVQVHQADLGKHFFQFEKCVLRAQLFQRLGGIDPNGGQVCSLQKYTGVDTGWSLRVPA